MDFKVFLMCYTLFGFCMETYSMQGCQTAPQKEILEMMNNDASPKTDKKRFVLAVPVINNSDKSEKRNKETPIIALRVLKPKPKVSAVKDRNHEATKASKNITPRKPHANDAAIKPLQNLKKLDDHEIKEHDLNDNLLEPHVNKSIESIHGNVGYVAKDQSDVELKRHATQSAPVVPELPEPGDINNIESPVKYYEAHNLDIPTINSNDIRKQVHARSLEDKTVNIYEEADPDDTQKVHAIANTTATVSKSLDKEKTPSADISSFHTKDLNNTSTKLEINNQLEDTSKLKIQNIKKSQCIDDTQNADCNKTEAVRTLPTILIERKAEEKKETVIEPTKKKYDNGHVSDIVHHTDERNSYPSTTHLYTHYQPPQHYPSHSQQPLNYDNQPPQYWKYHSYPMPNQNPSYASPVNYNNQVRIPYQYPNYPNNNQGPLYASPLYYDSQLGTQPYQMIPVYDYPNRWYDPQNIAVYASSPIYNNQATGYQQFVEANGYNRNDGFGYPLNYYDSYNQPTYYPTVNAVVNPEMNVFPQLFDMDPIKPDFTQAPPPYQYPFEKELSDLHLNDGNNYNHLLSYLDSRKGFWRIPKCNHYNWYIKQCRYPYQPRSYRPYKYYYETSNKSINPNWRRSHRKQSVDKYYAFPYEILSNQNLYSSQNEKKYRRKNSLF